MREPTGPLGEDVIRVWIDAPSARRAVIEVRRIDRSLARRALRIADFPADVAARLVAIATSEMVRVQARATLRRPAPRSEPDDGSGSDDDAAFRVDGGGMVLLLPSSEPLVLAGPEIALEHQRSITAQVLYARWLIGEGEGQRARWLEIGAAFDVRLPLSERWRARLALKAGGVAVSLPLAATIDELPTSGTDWTVRAGGLLGVEVELAPEAWLGLSVEPGASLRNLRVVDRSGLEHELGGFALGLGLGISASPFEATVDDKSRAQPSQSARKR
jgi:hypothetical protein